MELKPIIWMGSSREDLRSFPAAVQDEIGYALLQAQKGKKSNKAKPFKGFGNAAVLEIVENDVGETYRAVYTVKFKYAIVVIHVFHKKAKHKKETPKQDVELIAQRFKWAKQYYEEWLFNRGKQ